MRKIITLKFFVIAMCFVQLSCTKQVEPLFMDLSGDDWVLWLDKTAEFKKDNLYLTGTPLSEIPTNIPTGGWEVLSQNVVSWQSIQKKEYNKDEIIPPILVSVPGTVEEYLWNPNKGDYQGVSWWVKNVAIPAEKEGKKVKIHFRQGARMRCEVYVNQKLMHYNLVSGLPFEADITSALKFGEENEIAVRITDPEGNFGWADIRPHKWGNKPIPPSHGFGGILGNVELEFHNSVRINNLFVMNKPTITDIETTLEVENAGEEMKPVTVKIKIHEASNPSKVIYSTTDKQELEKGVNTIIWNINTPDVKIWDINNPNLYYIHFNIYDENKELLHSTTERFGYRWFEVTGQGSDAQFRLNGKRIVLRTAISWGYYPVNGMYATPEMARRHVQAAKDIGLNMLSFHRGMGCEIVLDMADEIGLLYYAEPGGYTAARKAKGDEFIRDWVSEKWLRMVHSMRNHPSLVIYNMINEQADTPDKRNHEDMALAHEIDPSRVKTYVSGWVIEGKKELKKLHMLPFDTTQYHYGWFDFHHARGWGSLQELHYRNAKTFFLNSDDKEEIVFYGEEGAIAVPPLLEKAVARYDASGKEGWDGTAYRSWLDAYKTYLKEKDWNQYYPSVDGLIQQMGELSHYYQGRIIENVRISDVLDGYAVNGYECERNENHSGVVDVFRNPKTDPKLMSHYAQPLYVALKAQNKIGHVNDNIIIDAFVVNEVDLKGEFTLKLHMESPNGNSDMVSESKVKITGGDVYGELINEAISIPMNKGTGRYNFKAELVNAQGEIVATGKEDAYIVDVDLEKIPEGGEVIDIAELTFGFLHDIPAYNAESYNQKYILLAQGDEEFSEVPARIMKSMDGTDGMVTLEVYDNEKCKGEPRKRVSVPRFRYDESTYPFEENLNLKPELGIRIVGNIIPEVTGNYQLEISHNWVTELHINGEKVMQGKNSVAGGKDGTEPLEYKFVKGKKYKVELISRKPFGRPFTHSALRWKAPDKSYDVNDLLAKVEKGTNLVIIHSPEPVLEALAEKGVIEYKKKLVHGHSWKGGIYFNKPHEIFNGLPQNTPFNWEYQVFTRYFGPRHRSFILKGEEPVVASVSGHQHLVGTALGIVKHGKGQVIFTTLDIAPHLNSDEEPALVAKKLLMNMLQYAAK